MLDLELTDSIQQGLDLVPGQIVGHWMGIDLLEDIELLVVEVVAGDFVMIGFRHICSLLPVDGNDDDEAPAHNLHRTTVTHKHSTPTAEAALINELSNVASGSPVTMATRRYVAS